MRAVDAGEVLASEGSLMQCMACISDKSCPWRRAVGAGAMLAGEGSFPECIACAYHQSRPEQSVVMLN